MTDVAPPTPNEIALRRRGFLSAWALIVLFIAVQATVNGLTVGRDRPQLDPIEPFIWEYSSGLLMIALVPGVAWLLRVAPPGRGRWLRFGLTALAGSVVFSAIHVGGFLVIRKSIYALLGAHYGSADLLYEYRKDAVVFAVFLSVLWSADRLARLQSRAGAESPPPRLYALRDGARTVRVPFDEIVAVTSARNYVEFHLADGGKPLVRDTLTKVEADLIAAGFLRTHRSWLVNPAHVRTVEPATGGDFRLALATGATAPLSRRFPDAIEALRRAA